MNLNELLENSKNKGYRKQLTLDELKAIMIVYGDGNYSRNKLLSKLNIGERRARKIYKYVCENSIEINENNLNIINNGI